MIVLIRTGGREMECFSLDMANTDTEKMLVENIGLAYKFASNPRYEKVVDIEGLTQACIVGLWKAIEDFDLSRDGRLSTFAYYKMHGEATNFLRNNHWMSGLKMQNSSEQPIYGESTVSNKVVNGGVEADGSLLSLFDILPQGGDFTEDVEKVEIIRNAIKECNFNEVQLYILKRFYWDDKTSKDISRELGVSTQRFWVRMKSIKAKLREKLEGVYCYEI